MDSIFISSLYILSGVCLFSSIHHGLIAFRFSETRSHSLFALLCLSLTLYIITKAGAYQAESPHDLVLLRRWEASFLTIFLGLLPWFLATYSGMRIRWLLIITSVLFGVLFIANLFLPYTIAYSDFPGVKNFTLPWGEQVTDLRILESNAWYDLTWLGLFLVIGYGFYACVSLYKERHHRKSFTLGLALGLFFTVTLLNLLINLEVVEFVHLAEFGFLSLIIVMSIGMIRSLNVNELQMRALLNNVPVAIYTKDPDGRYLFVNRQYEEIFHLGNEKVSGKTDHDLFPAVQADEFRINDNLVLESAKSVQYENLVYIDDVRHEFLTLKFPVLDPDGVPFAVCGIATDVTEIHKTDKELKLLRRQAWHADRVLRTGVMNASLAHELSQPLAAILFNAQAGLRFLKNSTPELGEIREILTDIVRDDKRAASIIKGLRAMLRQQETQRGHINLGDCISELLELMHTEFIEHQVESNSVIDPGCVIAADHIQIQQVILNLLINAIEAMPEQQLNDRRILVSLTRFNDCEARVAIRDTGIGIPGDKLDRIFDGYYTTKEKGLGIGLAMCRAIIESHSGRIRIDNNDGPGVTVSITLPLVAAGNIDKQINEKDDNREHV